jgi:hypothetical protein
MEMTDLELLAKTVKAYKEYIDSSINLSEQERSDLLMVARELDIEAESRGLYSY